MVSIPPDRASYMILTFQERAVLGPIARGLTDKEIGRELDMPYMTVKTHGRRIRDKVGLRNRVEIAVWAVRNGLA
jgi:DNA-binding NarL/FixJ family response regulator